jgi:hypothetical protein
MAVLPDAATAGALATAVFLLSLGLLVVFVESLRSEVVGGILIIVLVLSAVLVYLGEFGVALVLLAFGGAVIANQVFDWLTTR